MTGYQKLKDQNDKYKKFVKKVSALVACRDSEICDILKDYLCDLFLDLAETDD